MGLSRNLTTGEIAGQVALVRELRHAPYPAIRPRPAGHERRLHGHGRAAAQLRRRRGVRSRSSPTSRASRSPLARITVSTVGSCRRCAPSARRSPDARGVAARADDAIRGRIMPINKKYDLEALLAACRVPAEGAAAHHLRVRDARRASTTRMEDARRLVKLLDGIKGKINLLPLNAAPGIPFERPDDGRVDAFARILADKGLTVSVRKSRGRDIPRRRRRSRFDPVARAARPARAALWRLRVGPRAGAADLSQPRCRNRSRGGAPRVPPAHHGGRMATTRSGAPLPPAIFIGRAITFAPRVGRRSSAVRFSNAGMSRAKSARCEANVVDWP